MNNIQKLIDQATGRFVTGQRGDLNYETIAVFTPEQLKALLEQVAKEAFMEGAERGFKHDTPNFIQWWEANKPNI